MQSEQYNRIVSFIWNIADDVLRDLYVRGKYRDVILPMTVLRRLDVALEPTKAPSHERDARQPSFENQDQRCVRRLSQDLYNTSRFAMRDLRTRTNHAEATSDFVVYLDGFSPNVQDILEKFEFRNQITKLSKADVLGLLIEKFLDQRINLSPYPLWSARTNKVVQPGLDNHSMGTVFEELVRRFNEDNNEEAGEHWTPRDAIRAMANLIFLPVADSIQSGTDPLYDGACGTGGMLTVAEETLKSPGEPSTASRSSLTCMARRSPPRPMPSAKADFLIRGEGEAADNIVGGPEYSTLSNDAFPSREFDFMLSNPPYGKSWKSDLERVGRQERGSRIPVLLSSMAMILTTR